MDINVICFLLDVKSNYDSSHVAEKVLFVAELCRDVHWEVRIESVMENPGEDGDDAAHADPKQHEYAIFLKKNEIEPGNEKLQANCFQRSFFTSATDQYQIEFILHTCKYICSIHAVGFYWSDQNKGQFNLV